MRIITRTVRMKHRDERFLLCDACNTSFVANLREAARVQADDTFEDGIVYDYTFRCPVCGANVHLPNERTAV